MVRVRDIVIVVVRVSIRVRVIVRVIGRLGSGFWFGLLLAFF